MATDQTPQVPWNEMQTQWRRNLLAYVRDSLEFKMLMHQSQDLPALLERYGLAVHKASGQTIIALVEDQQITEEEDC